MLLTHNGPLLVHAKQIGMELLEAAVAFAVAGVAFAVVLLLLTVVTGG